MGSSVVAIGGLLTALTAVTALAACSGKNGPGAQNPERQAEAEYDLARDLFTRGDSRSALNHALKAVELNDEGEKAPYLVAGIYLSFCSTSRGFESPDCKLKEAEKYARLSIKANPQYRDASNMLGQILINQKRFKEAISTLEPLTKDPAYSFPHYAWGNLGWAQVQDGQVDAGIASLKNAVAEPRFCVGHYHLGVAYEKKGDLAQAEASFTTAVTADPVCGELQDAWEGRGRVRLRLGRKQEARQDFERCREISSETSTGKVCVRELATLPAPPASPSPAAPAPGATKIAVHPKETRKT